MHRLAFSVLVLFSSQIATAQPPATVTLNDGTVIRGTLERAAEGSLYLRSENGRRRSVPLSRVDRIDFNAKAQAKASDAQRKRNPRVGVARLEGDLGQITQRLNRIGADWKFVPPEANSQTLGQFDVVCFAGGWGKLDGLAALADNYHQFVRQGGGLLFAQPDVTGDASAHPALKLLPHAVDVQAYPSTGAGRSTVAYHADSPHPLTREIAEQDLPHPYDLFANPDKSWTVLARSTGVVGITLLAAEPGDGRVVMHAGFDDYGHRNYLSDAYYVRMLKWLAGRPDEDVVTRTEQLGPRRWPEYVKTLEADFEAAIVRASPAAQAAIQKAESLLRVDAQQAATWTSYRQAVDLLLAHPSRAAIPRMLIVLSDDRLNHDTYDDHLYEVFGLLTGQKVVGNTPEEVARRWWIPQREKFKIAAQPETRSEASLALSRLLEIVKREEPGGLARKPPLDTYHVELILRGGYRLYAGKYRAMLYANLLPAMLEAADDPDRRWLVIGPLAAMYKIGQAKGLPAIVADEKQPAARRIVAAAALYRAQEKLSARALAHVFSSATTTDIKQAAAWLLGQDKSAIAIETVVSCLQVDDEALNEIAAVATYSQQSPDAVEPLVQLIIEKWKADQSTRRYFGALTRIRDERTTQGLARLLRTVSDRDPQNKFLAELLPAFSSATGEPFGEPADPMDQRVAWAMKWWASREKSE